MVGDEGPAIGIYLGTTYSCVGVWLQQHNRVEIIHNDQGNRTTPSFVAFTDHVRLIGDAAKNQSSYNPTNTIYDSNRLIGRNMKDSSVQKDVLMWPFKVISGADDKPLIVVNYRGQEKKFGVEEISAMILSMMRDVAEAFMEEPVKNAVITVPAYFNNSQWEATRDAGVIAGLNVMRIINEPTAAAIAYSYEKKKSSSVSEPRNILVFDLGGGTLDVSLVTVRGDGVIRVRATGGNCHLGGEDFDNRMVKYFVEEFKRKHKKDVSRNSRAVRRLKSACEKAKMTLSFEMEALVELEGLHRGIDFVSSITRAKFNSVNIDLLAQCMGTVCMCIEDSKMNKKEIDDIVLVGGSTRIPKLKQMLEEFFEGKEIKSSMNPDETVAHGAALLAASLIGEGGESMENMLLSDITHLSLGVGDKGDIMSVIIPKNTTIPCEMNCTYTTWLDDQTEIGLKVYQGERKMSSENNLLGVITVEGIPSAPRGVPEVVVEFMINVDGILTVCASEKSGGNKSEIMITESQMRLTGIQIKKMIEEAKENKDQDERYVREVEENNIIEDCIYKYIRNRYYLRAGEKINRAVSNAMLVLQAHLDLPR